MTGSERINKFSAAAPDSGTEGSEVTA